MIMAKRYLTSEQRRSALKLAYADRNWVDKVNKMPAKQVYAIFDKLKRDCIINLDSNGNLYFLSRSEANELKRRKEIAHGYHQITLDEFFGDILKEKEKENK